MNRLTLLLPPRVVLAADAALASGPIASWLRRGDLQPSSVAGRETALREQFQFAGTALPVAALTRESDCGDAAGSTWLRADPAHVRADMATARMLACGDLGLDATDCEALLRALRPLFGDSGFPIDAPVPSRWYLRAPAGAQLPAFVSPDRALGDDLRLHLPDGNEGRRWRSLLNEAHEPVVVWKVKRAWPTKVASTDLNASGNETAIETLVLTHEGLTMENG